MKFEGLFEFICRFSGIGIFPRSIGTTVHKRLGVYILDRWSKIAQSKFYGILLSPNFI